MEQQPKRTSFFDGMSPMQVFIFGIVEGILVLCTIGFFILLVGTTLRGDMGNSPSGRTVSAAVPTAPSEDAGAAQPSANVQISPVDKDNDHIRGNKDAKISIVEFSDYECPFCTRFHNTMNQVMDKYGDDVNWVFRHFPLESIHPNARLTAIGAECAGEQGKFWEFSDAVFAHEGSLNATTIKSLAQNAGVKNVGQFNTCLDERKYNDVVSADSAEAQRAGGRGTPYSILIGPNGQMIPINGAQPFENVERAIQQVL